VLLLKSSQSEAAEGRADSIRRRCSFQVLTKADGFVTSLNNMYLLASSYGAFIMFILVGKVLLATIG
jgi:hypothetical protein